MHLPVLRPCAAPRRPSFAAPAAAPSPRRAAALVTALAALAASAAADDAALARRVAVRHVPVPAWLVGEAPDWIDPEAPPPDLPWKDLERAPAWSASVRTNEAPLRTAARFRDAELLPLLRREAGLPLPDGTPLRADAEALADRLFAAAWEDDPRIYDRLVRDLGPEADRLEAAGFTNPVVSFVRTAARSRREKDPWPEAGRASPAFSELLRVGAVYQTRQPADLEAELVRAAAAWCGSLASRPEDSRAAWRFLAFLFRFRDAAPPGLADALDEAGADPWLGHLVRAYGAKALAWKARGGDCAPTAKPEGLRGFHERLSDAWREALEAFRLHPEFPEAARLLLDVHGAAGGGPGNAAEDLWFARALEAEIDEPQTYRDYLWYVCYPRRGGSVREMKRFARACHATHRHDTMIPEQYANAMGCAAQETGTPRDAFFAEGKAFKRLSEVYSALSTNADARAELRWKAQARLPVFLWRNGLAQPALEANRRKEPGADVQLDAPDWQEDGRLLDLLCGEHGDALVPFESWWRTAFPSVSLLPSLRALLDRADWTPRERAHLLLRENQLRLQFPDAFDPGAWTGIPFDETFSLFAGAPAARFDAPWWAEPLDSEMGLRPLFDLPADYELEGVVQPTDRRTWSCQVELGPPKAPGPPRSIGGAEAVAWTPPVPPTVGWGLWPFLGTNACFVSLGADLYREARESVVDWFPPTDGEIPFRVVVRGNAVSLWLGGREVFRDRECTAPPLTATRTKCAIAFGLSGARLRGLRFRAARPEWAGRLEEWSAAMRERAAGTNAEARADYIENELLPFWRRELVEPFLAGPEGTNAWAPRAAELMERELRFLADGSVVDCSGTPGEGDARDRSDLIGFVERSGTANPFLLFLRAAAIRERLSRVPSNAGQPSWRWAEPARREALALEKSLASVPGAELGRLLAAAATMRAADYQAEARTNAAVRAAEWLAARRPAPDEERAARWLLVDLFEKDSEVAALAAALDAAGDAVPAWIRLLARGQERLAEARAQARRGSSERVRFRYFGGDPDSDAEPVARSVSAAAQAREALEAAWALRRDPVSAALLVEAAALEGADDAAAWLARATEAEPDNTLAYGKYEWNVARPNPRMPGGGGSRAHQRAFAAACGAAGMDGSAPGFFFLRASLQDVAESGGTFEGLLERDPALFARLERIAAAVRDNAGLPSDARRFAGRAAATLALARGDLRAASDAQKRRPGRSPLYFNDANWPRGGETELALAGLGGEHAEALVALMEKDRAGDAAGVIAAGDALLAAGALDPAETALAARLADARRFERDFATGAWCPVRFEIGGTMVNALNAPNFSHEAGFGGWTAGPGWLATPEHNAGLLRLQWPVPRDLELRGVVEWDETKVWSNPSGPDPMKFATDFSVRLDRATDPMVADRYDPVHVALYDDERVAVAFGGAGAADSTGYHRPDRQRLLPRRTRRTPVRIRFDGGRALVRAGDGAEPLEGGSWTPPEPGPDGLRLTFSGCSGFRLHGLELRNPALPEPAGAEPWPPAALLAEDAPASLPPALDPLGVVAGAAGGNAIRTWAAFRDGELLPLLRRVTLERFEAGPEAGEPWAAEARAEIEEALFLAWYDRMTRRPASEWEPAARLVSEHGAKDLFLRWMAAMHAVETGRRDEARALLAAINADTTLGAGTGAWHFVRMLVAVAAWRNGDGGAKDRALREALFWAREETYGARRGNGRAVLHVLRELFEGKDLAPALEAAVAEKTGVDPWLALCARGFEENALAANAVWRKDGDPLESARRFDAATNAFARAWELHPEWPEPAVGMLEGWGDRLSPEERDLWLRRGLAAEGDGLALLDRYFRGAIEAAGFDREGAKRAAMAELGRALVGTGRFDTQLPVEGAALIVDGLAPPAARPKELWREDADCALLYRVADEMAARCVSSWVGRESVQGYAAVCAAIRGEPELRVDFSRPCRYGLHKEAPHYGGCPFRRPFGSSGEAPNRAANLVVPALLGPNGEALAEVERAFRADGPAAAAAKARALLDAPPGPLAEEEVDYLVVRVDDDWLASAVPGGPWFELPAAEGGHAARWDFINRGAKIDGDRFVFQAGFREGGGGTVRWRTAVPRDLEARLRFRRAPDAPDGEDAAVAVHVQTPSVDFALPVVFAVLHGGRLGLAAVRRQDMIGGNPEPTVWLDAGDGDAGLRIRWLDGTLSVWAGDSGAPALETDAFRPAIRKHGPKEKHRFSIDGGHAAVSGIAVRLPPPAASSPNPDPPAP